MWVSDLSTKHSESQGHCTVQKALKIRLKWNSSLWNTKAVFLFLLGGEMTPRHHHRLTAVTLKPEQRVQNVEMLSYEADNTT